MVMNYLEPDGYPFRNGCFNWMMNQIFTMETWQKITITISIHKKHGCLGYQDLVIGITINNYYPYIYKPLRIFFPVAILAQVSLLPGSYRFSRICHYARSPDQREVIPHRPRDFVSEPKFEDGLFSRFQAADGRIPKV